jgi:hypothetical protein
MLSALEDIDRAFFGVCIEAGKQVLGAMMEHDRTALCGQPWKPDEKRSGRRAGSTESPVTLGGRRIAIRRPRVRSIEGEELSLPSFEAATDRDPLDRHTLEAVAAGVSTLCANPGSTVVQRDRTIDLEERRLSSVRRIDRAEAWRVAQPTAR